MASKRKITSPSASDNEYHHPHSVEELTESNIRAIARLESASRSERGMADRVADSISDFCGSMLFVYVHIVWFGIWIILNVGSIAPKAWHFDPYPFQFLTLIVSLEAIFLSTFILISQNRQGRVGERRNQLDLQINLLAEQESSKMLKMLDEIQTHLGIQGGDPDIHVLEEATRPDTLVQQIEQIMERHDSSAPDGSP